MAIREILKIPNPVLRQKSEPVAVVDDDARRLMDDMLETMYAAPGIGLAAVQIGVPRRVVTIDISKDEGARQPMFFINPRITWSSEERSTYDEGCLSIPERYETVERPARIRVAFLDRDGKEQEIEAEGLLATCLQHEIDHLEGVLFIDHLSRLKREMIWRAFQKEARQAERRPATGNPRPAADRSSPPVP